MNTIALRKYIWLGLPVLLLLALAFLARSAWFAAQPEALAIGITLDLVLTVPAVYLLVIWRTSIPKTTAVPVFVLGIVLGHFLLPVEHQFYLLQVKQWVLPLVELGVLGFVGYQIHRFRKQYKAQRTAQPDFYSALQEVCAQTLPKGVGSVLAAEVASVYYGLLLWKKTPLAPNAFTYHKNTGTVALLWTLVLVIPVEAGAIHLLVERWSPVFAWVLTVLSVYSGFQLLGMARALGKRPIVCAPTHLQLRYGIMGEVDVPWGEIVEIRAVGAPLEAEGLTQLLSPLGDLDSHNIMLTLKAPMELQGLWGMKKSFQVLGFHIDDKQAFLEMTQGYLEN